MIEMMVGRKSLNKYPRIECEKGEPILEVKNLKNKFVDNVSFDVKGGEIVGISETMGAGRTRLPKLYMDI